VQAVRLLLSAVSHRYYDVSPQLLSDAHDLLFAFSLIVLFVMFSGTSLLMSVVYFEFQSPYSINDLNTVWGGKDGNYFVYKLYPDVVIFYAWLTGIIVLAALAIRDHTFYVFLHRRVQVSWLTAPYRRIPIARLLPVLRSQICPIPRLRALLLAVGFDGFLSRGEIIMHAFLWGIIIIWFCFWTGQFPSTFNYLTSNVALAADNNYNNQVAARVFGHISNLLLSLIILPVSKTGLWVDVFGVSFERALRIHRILGMMGYTAILTHMGIWWSTWDQMGLLYNNIAAYDSLKINRITPRPQNWSIPVCELAFLLVTVGLIAMIFFRRKVYHSVSLFHRYAGIVLYVTAVWHAWSFWFVYE
jgi:hypothetical protein